MAKKIIQMVSLSPDIIWHPETCKLISKRKFSAVVEKLLREYLNKHN